MLKKLLKYDLKYIYKSQMPFYITTIISALLINLCNLKTETAIFRYIIKILAILTIVLMIGIILNNIIKLWTRFINNIYKDESYLTHTLPVTKQKIYLSKFLTGVITMTTSILVIILVILLLSYTLNGLETFTSALKGISIFSNNNILLSIIIVLLVYGVEIMNIIQIGYTGIILGHKSNNNKIIKSFLYGFICYIIVSLLSLLIIYIVGLFNPKLLDLFLENKIPSPTIIKSLLIGVTSMYIVIIMIFYIINVRLFKRGVNVE